MPSGGDTFYTTLKKAHLEWGTHRHTSTRGIVYGEGYLHIPRADAQRIGIYNSNQVGVTNTFICNSTDGYLTNTKIKASGSTASGDIFAKQFQGDGNLQVLGNWFSSVNAKIGDRVRVTWVNQNEIEIEKL
jgi:hypothetical protein